MRSEERVGGSGSSSIANLLFAGDAARAGIQHIESLRPNRISTNLACAVGAIIQSLQSVSNGSQSEGDEVKLRLLIRIATPEGKHMLRDTLKAIAFSSQLSSDYLIVHSEMV